MLNNFRPQISLVVAVVAVLLVAQCSKSPSDDDEQPDKVPPDAIADLVVTAVTSHSVMLRWTAPHDYRADHSAGLVDGYDLRIAYDSITGENFADQYQLDSVPEPMPAGVAQFLELDELIPDSMYYFALKSCDDQGNWSAISNCCQAHCPGIQVVTFPDTALDRVIRQHINKPSGDILSSDLDTIFYLVAQNEHITDLSGLENLTSLQGLSLNTNEVTDLTPLANLQNIWGLDISSNHVSDLSPLSGLTGLRQLGISDNPISNLDALASLTALQQLFMFATQVTDFSPLYGLSELDDVIFSLMNLTDISFMSHLTHLRICKLNSNHITSVEPLAGLTALEGLDLSLNQITDIQALVDNTGLSSGDHVDLSGNPLSQQAIDVEVPILQSRGVVVTW